VLPVAKIPGALVKYNRRMALTRTQNSLRPQDTARDWLPEIIDLLRMKTAHDFALYKQGTLRRRIERRMAMAAIGPMTWIGISKFCGATQTNSTFLPRTAHQCHQLLP